RQHGGVQQHLEFDRHSGAPLSFRIDNAERDKSSPFTLTEQAPPRRNSVGEPDVDPAATPSAIGS
ncbi:MAG: hypothetical protein K8F57_06730, partial [Alphaproteobacteria bacterium]|nr:hypothetical protein [Alphaproteobacteria bacterium]